jgi:hypothetical protein
MKKNIGKVITFKFKGRKDNITGVVLNYNDTWTLVKRCVDYSLDGYTIFKNENVQYLTGEYEKRVTKILKLKKYSAAKERSIPINSLDDILPFIDKKYKLIQVDTKDGAAFDVVKYTGKKGDYYLLNELMPDAKWRDKLTFKEKVFRCISFDNNYLNSLALITKF